MGAVDRLIAKVGEKAFATIAAALAASIVALVASIERYFARRKAYKKGVQDERERWKQQEEIWKRKVGEIKKSQLSMWQKLKEIQRLKKEFEEYKKRNKKNS